MRNADVDFRSLGTLLAEWLVIVATITIALRIDSIWALALASIVVATRQHALLILFHDAVHGHLAGNRRVNDALINLLAGVPTLLPVELYRPLHLQHHRTLGTAADPERRLLYARQRWNYRPLPAASLAAQLLGDLFLVNGIRTIVAWTRDPLPARLAATTLIIALGWSAAVAAALIIAPRQTITIVLLWLAPLLTLTQLLQKLRSYAEHSGGPNVTRGWPHWTYSWRPGLAGRLTIWPYRINYHREHHEEPALHWHELPGRVTERREHLPGSRLIAVLMDTEKAT